MDVMGEKICGGKEMIGGGVGVVGGREEGVESVEEGKEMCNKMGYGVMVKGCMGGGGKGMGVIDREDEVEEGYNSGG